MTSPWSLSEGESDPAATVPVLALLVVGLVGFLGVPLAAALLAHRNLRAGRGDRRGAGKIAVVVGGLHLIGWLFRAHYAISPEQLFALGGAVGRALLWAAVAWVGYLAVEPHFRRHWPTQLVTWSRLLEARVGDQMVSRHLLLGLLAALLIVPVMGTPPPIPDTFSRA